jgi:hypothetical protein
MTVNNCTGSNPVDVPDDGRVRSVVGDGRTVALARCARNLGTLDNRCPNRGGPLGEGPNTRGEDAALLSGSTKDKPSSRRKPMSRPDTEKTRRSLHAVAELVLAGPQHRRTGTIKLIVTPTGFHTFTGPALAVEGTDLVTATGRVPISGSSCAALADAAGVDVGAPEALYHDGSGMHPDDVLDLDPVAARWLEDCWAAGDAALRRLAPQERPILWPEHFDVGILTDGVSFGVSPGDTHLAEPYAYVGPPTRPADPFWNYPFGAARSMRELDDGNPDAVLAFFTEGRRRADAA